MSVQLPNPLEASPDLLNLLDQLHRQSEEEEKVLDITKYTADSLHDAVRDKFIALDQDKAQFVYQIARATNAKNIVEVGTSFGVSTIYLGLAVSRNIEATGGTGIVIGTEHEPSKAEKAHKNWNEAGEIISRHIDLRVGDLRDTLKVNLPQLDLVLIDIWAPMTLPALKLVQPKLRYGAIIIVDNTVASAARYKDLLAHLRAPDSGFTNLTLPFNKGLEMSVYLPSKTFT